MIKKCKEGPSLAIVEDVIIETIDYYTLILSMTFCFFLAFAAFF